MEKRELGAIPPWAACGFQQSRIPVVKITRMVISEREKGPPKDGIMEDRERKA